ncbi:PIN-like domain-containing protein [Lentzea chajnantorensis]
MTGGIFNGFEDYRTPTSDDYRRTLTGGLVVFDANVLLNLYRFNSTTRSDLIKVMQSLGDSLWVPHQVQREFWRNRESVIDQLGQVPRESLTKLEKAHKDAEEAVRLWSNRVSLPEGDRAGLLKELAGAFATVHSTISRQSAADAHSHDTNSDVVVEALGSILAGRIGPALPPEEHAAAVVEANRRIAAQEPPGYLDKDKADEDERAGDYLVWKQVLIEAEGRSCDVLLVTSDVKEDWWRRAKGQLRGPRLELMAELRAVADRRLFMITPSELIRRAAALTDVQVNPRSADDIERVENAPASSLPPHAEREVVARVYREVARENDAHPFVAPEFPLMHGWLRDPEIGGLLDSHLTPQAAEIWLRDVMFRKRLQALHGLGQYADLVPLRYQTAEEVLAAACGPDWRFRSGTVKPGHGYGIVTNGVSKRAFSWGAEPQFDDLLSKATRYRDQVLDRPLVAIVQLAAPSDEERYRSTAAEEGCDLVFVQLELRPNPDYAG